MSAWLAPTYCRPMAWLCEELEPTGDGGLAARCVKNKKVVFSCCLVANGFVSGRRHAARGETSRCILCRTVRSATSRS